MAKIQFSDVVPKERRSIRDVPIPNSGKRKVPIITKPDVKITSKPDLVSEKVFVATTPKLSEVADIKNNKAYEYYYPKDKNLRGDAVDNPNKPTKNRFIFGGLAFIAIVIFIVSMMTIFASATILITPKSQNIEVMMDLSGAISGDESSVKYEVIKAVQSSTLAIKATGEELVELKARGKIVVYNNFSFEPQRLIIRTRFESGTGLTYRIPESIVVPGKSVKDGTTIPGSIEVEVFADEPGEKYNIKKSDFTIPGFKNDAERYKNFYARSVTDLSGGFIGKMQTVSSNEKVAALQSIESEVRVLLEKDFRSKIGDGLVLLSDSIIYESRDLPQTEESGSVILGREVTAYAILLDARGLSKKIVSGVINNYPDWQNIGASIQDFTTLSMTQKPSIKDLGQKINIQVSGQAKFWADIDTGLISQRLVGVGKKEAAKLVDEFAGISTVIATIRPMWKRSFPQDPSKISVQTVMVK